MITITFPDGSQKEFKAQSTGIDIANSISEGLARATIAIEYNGVLMDATQPLTTSGKIRLLTFNDKEGQEVFRHSSAHLLAHAVKRLYPEAIATIGPVVQEGFYYDFDNLDIGLEDLEKIEAEMKKIVKEALPIERIQYDSKEEALVAFKDNPYKIELINEFEDNPT
ncbi:MAG: TGS domain-containing protein, partial [Candidatus Nanoarchaeia archaeon]